LGSEVGDLLAKLSESDLEKMEVELPIGLTGTFTDPNIKLNTKTAVQDLTQRIVEKQKENLAGEAKDALGKLLGGNKPQDSTATKTEEPITEKNKEEKIKEAAENILGGLFGGKKKDSTEQK